MAPPARRSGSRLGVGFMLVGVLLAALLVGGDRLILHLVEARAGQQLRTRLGAVEKPQVSIRGFPFVTQLLRGSASSVHLVAGDVSPPDQRGLTLDHLDLTLQDVTSPDRFQSFHADEVDGSAVLGYPAAKQLTGYPVSYAPEGRVQITVESSFLSSPLPAKVEGRPVVDPAGRSLTLADPKVSVAGLELPEVAARSLVGSALKPVPLGELAFGLSITGLTATPDGLQAQLTGSDVTFSR